MAAAVVCTTMGGPARELERELGATAIESVAVAPGAGLRLIGAAADGFARRDRILALPASARLDPEPVA